MAKLKKRPRIECAVCHATFYKDVGQCPNCRWIPPRPGPPDLTRTRKMLAWYDAQEARRTKLLDDVLDDRNSTTEQAQAALGLWETHANAVRKAFHLDTNDRNSLDCCMLVDISWLRQISDPNYKFVTRRPK